MRFGREMLTTVRQRGHRCSTKTTPADAVGPGRPWRTTAADLAVYGNSADGIRARMIPIFRFNPGAP